MLGQQVSDRTIEEIAQEVQSIDPPAFPAIDRIDIGHQREVLVVSVATGQSRPYSYRGQAYRRVGNTSPALSRDEYNRMLLARLHGEHRWENEAAAGWGIADGGVGAALGMGETPWTIREDLATLKTLGLVKGMGWGRGALWVPENQ